MIDIVDWRFTDRCNNNCFYCYANTNKEDIDYKSKIIILDKLIKFGCKSICLSGGEPMINDWECVDFINYAYKQNVKIHLSTNGLNYLRHMHDIHNKIVRLSLPLDGFDSKKNTCNGRNYGAYDTVIEILESISSFQKNPFIKINTTVTALNCSVDNLIQIYNILKKYNINFWEIYEFIPENRGATNFEELKIEADAFDQLKKHFNDKIRDHRFNIEFASRKSRNSRYFIIQPDGVVIVPVDKGYAVEEIAVGNLLKDELKEVVSKWENVAIADSTFQKKRIMQSQE